MKELAAGLFLLRQFPPNSMNVYLMGGVLIDAATRFSVRRIERELRGREVSAHALTHAHPDHQGSSHAICVKHGIELWCGEADRRAVETGRVSDDHPPHWINSLLDRAWSGPAHPVARSLREGDEVGGFTVLDVPGHSAGHVSYWRESDRVLVLGDVLNNMDLRTSIPGLHEPPTIFTPNISENRRSARKLARLEPALICFGHGPPLRDTRKFVGFVDGLPD